jgi:hypothetical protein
MATTTTTRTTTVTHTATFLCDAIHGSVVEIMTRLGLATSALSWTTRYEPAIKAWIAEQSLSNIVLECTTPAGTVSQFHFDINYTDGTAPFRLRNQTLAGYYDKIARLPTGTTWRIICDHRGYHTPQPGWSSTTFSASNGLANALGTLARAPYASVGVTAFGGI